MSWSRRSWKTPVLVSLAVAGAVLVPGTAYGGEGPGGPGGPAGRGGPGGQGLWASAAIEPGWKGVVEVGGYEGEPLGEGSVLTLTAPAKARVTGVPFAGLGYRGAVTPGGNSGTYTFVGGAVSTWKGHTFPFVVSVDPDAEPGTRLPDCTLALRDAEGTVVRRGTCSVTVALPAPVLSHPASGVPLGALPETSGTAYPGAQITVRDAQEDEVCTTTAAPNGTWSCVPARALPAGAGRLQATATLNGVSATSEQIDIVVTGSARDQHDTVSDGGGGRRQVLPRV
ncbi:carboxypeptidase regulatory-like domain-containing protein [Streptomyces sp. bgisy034]|uniref:carboxypeptidase regulatory-like domain-containing protein n=1 Tax=Streptomyces sp. bgisy034 TaxID=3413774 RepID=UPI003EBFFBAF